MEINQKQQYMPENGQPADTFMEQDARMGEVVPGVPVVRSNTPRPLSFEAMISQQNSTGQPTESFQIPNFPSRAPSAPPLPEELGEREEEVPEPSPMPAFPSQVKAIVGGASDFSWLFEYALEMDSSLLNAPDALDGQALLYGVAVLKGYSLMLGTLESANKQDRTIATAIPDPNPNAEVWGLLYRVPRRVIERATEEPSLLQNFHSAGTAQSPFREITVVVRDTYRDREITCTTYVATEQVCLQAHLVPISQAANNPFAQRLVELVRKLQFPLRYLGLAASPVSAPPPTTLPAANGARPSYNTEPLPVMSERGGMPTVTHALPETPLASAVSASYLAPVPSSYLPLPPRRPSRLLTTFAAYLVILLLAVLTFAVLQGLGLMNRAVTASFTPLGVPWLVMLYGLAGGCISSLATLAHYRLPNPPLFVMITWFTRPFIGSLLAAFAYLLLISGVFTLSHAGNQHTTLFLLAGALAGLCEGWTFFRYK